MPVQRGLTFKCTLVQSRLPAQRTRRKWRGEWGDCIVAFSARPSYLAPAVHFCDSAGAEHGSGGRARAECIERMPCYCC